MFGIEQELKGLSKCELFEYISKYIWNEVTKNNRRGNNVDENGYTKNSIISLIQDFVEVNNTNKVFAQRSIKEVNRGGDLEVYLEIEEEQYIRFILQAKILKSDGHYNDVDREAGSTNKKQWDVLKQYSKSSRSIPLYLFYNGTSEFSNLKTNKDCKGNYDYTQLGCAIESPDVVIAHFSTNKHLGLINNGQAFGIPWRKITCCPHTWKKVIKTNSIRLYSPEEIDMDEYFEPFFSNFEAPSLGKLPTIEYMTNSIEPAKQIHKNLHASGFEPVGRVILNKREQKKKTTTIYILG